MRSLPPAASGSGETRPFHSRLPAAGADCPGTATPATRARELDARRRRAAPAGPGRVLHMQPHGAGVHAQRRLGSAAGGEGVGQLHTPAVELQVLELHAPRRRAGTRGRHRRGRRRWRRQRLQVPAPLTIPQHGQRGLHQLHTPEIELVGDQVETRVGHRELLERQFVARAATAARHEAQCIEAGVVDGERQARRGGSAAPVETALQGGAAFEPRQQSLRHVGRELGQGELGQLHRAVRLALAEVAVDAELPGWHRARRLAAQGGRHGQGRRCSRRPPPLLRAHAQPIELQRCRRPRGGVVPGHPRVVDLDLVEAGLPHGAGCGRRRRRSRCTGCTRCRRGCRRSRATEGLQIQAPGGIAGHVELRAVELQRAQRHAPCERLHVAQVDLQLPPREQRRARGVGHGQVLQAGAAAEHHARVGALGQLETQREVGTQCPLLQAQRQRRGQVAGVAREVEIGEGQFQLALATRSKGRGLRTAVEGRTVEPEGHVRLRRHFHERGQVGQEGQRYLHRVELVQALDRPVVETDRGIAQLQVVERESLRFGRSRRRGRRVRRETREQVVDVVVARRRAREFQLQSVELQRRDHRRTPPQRAGVGIHVGTGQFQQRLRAARRRADDDVVQRELQAPGAEVHRTDADAAAQQLGQPRLRLRLEQWRHHQPGQRPQGQQHAQRDGEAARPGAQARHRHAAPDGAPTGRCEAKVGWLMRRILRREVCIMPRPQRRPQSPLAL